MDTNLAPGSAAELEGMNHLVELRRNSVRRCDATRGR